MSVVRELHAGDIQWASSVLDDDLDPFMAALLEAESYRWLACQALHAYHAHARSTEWLREENARLQRLLGEWMTATVIA